MIYYCIDGLPSFKPLFFWAFWIWISSSYIYGTLVIQGLGMERKWSELLAQNGIDLNQIRCGPTSVGLGIPFSISEFVILVCSISQFFQFQFWFSVSALAFAYVTEMLFLVLSLLLAGGLALLAGFHCGCVYSSWHNWIRTVVHERILHNASRGWRGLFEWEGGAVLSKWGQHM